MVLFQLNVINIYGQVICRWFFGLTMKYNKISFFTFRDNLFSLNHWDIFDNSVSIILYKVLRSLCLKNRFVSSANIMNIARIIKQIILSTCYMASFKYFQFFDTVGILKRRLYRMHHRSLWRSFCTYPTLFPLDDVSNSVVIHSLFYCKEIVIL